VENEAVTIGGEDEGDSLPPGVVFFNWGGKVELGTRIYK
jgi:hypothetical protein